MTIEKYRHPILFYVLATIIPWGCWFVTAYLSHLEPSTHANMLIGGILAMIGLASPMIIAGMFIFPEKDLREDVRKRFFNVSKIRPVFLWLTGFLMLGSILLAQAISLLFGHSIQQFAFSDAFSFSAGIFPAWFLIFIAPLLEELAWHSYGTDCLRSRFSLFTTSMIFGVYWALWHFPLSFIKGYYQSNLAETGILYSINFAVSLIPYVLLMNWLYYKTNRNIFVAIIFHITAGFFNEIFSTHPDSKVIQTVLLLILSIILLCREREFFFTRELISTSNNENDSPR